MPGESFIVMKAMLLMKVPRTQNPNCVVTRRAASYRICRKSGYRLSK